MAADPGTAGALAQLRPTRLVLDAGRRWNLWLFDVGLACCAVEFLAASLAGDDIARLGAVPLDADPRTADVLVVSGTVTHRTAPLVHRLWELMPEPRSVLSFGACANSGGPYWDSYSVTKGIDQVVPVDVYVPGCPPRPQALLDGLVQLQRSRELPARTGLQEPPLRPAGAGPVGPRDLRGGRP